MSQQYKFSIVMAIYNMEDYLENTIQCLINQTIGFKKNVQLVMVNDGSADSSHEICEKYKNRYPDNIIYINKENGGVSSARNAGLEVVTGEYVNFLDADDALTEETLENVYNFFKKHHDEVDLVSVPLVYFEAKEGNHLLNYKFKETRVIDIMKEPDCFQMSISSSFVKREEMVKYRFNPNLKYGEDAELVNKIILNCGKYGVVKEAAYLYRFRASDSSAMQRAKKSKAQYLDVLKYLHLELIDVCKKKYGEVIPYLQQVIMYETVWKIIIRKVGEDTLTDEEKKEFLEIYKNIIQNVDDTVIYGNTHVTINYILYILSLKYGKTYKELATKIETMDDIIYAYDHYMLCNVSKARVFLDICEVHQDELELEGKYQIPNIPDQVDLYMEDRCYKNGKATTTVTKLERINRNYNNVYSLSTMINQSYTFIHKQKIEKGSRHKFNVYVICDGKKMYLNIEASGESHLASKCKTMFSVMDDRLIYIVEGGLRIEDATVEKMQLLNRDVMEEIYSIASAEESALIGKLRKQYIDNYEKDKNRKIWLISDRINRADDNGEHLYKYCKDIDDGVEKYFVISADCSDYERVKKFSNVIEYGSMKHYYYTLIASEVISSHADESVYKPFVDIAYGLVGFNTAKRVFLQHGITKDDMSGWLKRKSKNIAAFITAVRPEYESIINEDYGYLGGQVYLTGFARYDNLSSNPKKHILYVPTWESNLTYLVNGKTAYNEKYKESNQFKKINSLLNNPDLLDCLKKNGYTLMFRPHPNMMIQIEDFDIQPGVEIVDENLSYQEMMKEGALLITDYSSVQYDFAYMQKPVLYYQFAESHLERGYYNYETMGFGEVVSEERDLVDLLQKYMERDCVMPEKYVERLKSFFEFHDKNNCERIYNVLTQLQD